jgi:peroxiredoxin
MRVRTLALLSLLAMTIQTARGEGAPKSVADLQAAHDRALIRDLAAYILANPTSSDVDQAYMALFDKVIEHDWFAEHEDVAKQYLAAFPDGPVASLARIVATMARAHAGRFDEALARYKELMGSLGKTEQEEFAANFADSLASASTAAGEYGVSRQVYEILLGRYGDSPTLRQKVRDELIRLELVGKPAPSVAVSDVKGAPLRLSELRGKYVLVDFWATWCAPCVAELPRLQAAYARYRDSGFEIVGVSLDESKTALTDFVQVRKVNWRQVHNASGGGDLVEAFGVKTIPATFLIDPNGVITRLELRGPALDEALTKLLTGPNRARASR